MINRLKLFLLSIYDVWLRSHVGRTWLRDRARARPHTLPKPLIVSLTSYPVRYPMLEYTLKSLLAQSVRADNTILWIAHGDKAALPESITSLEAHGLTICYCDDVRSHKKYAYAFKAYPDALIVTADDDAYYWPTWLAELIASYRPGQREIPCHRAHKIALSDARLPAAYESWEHNTDDGVSSPRIFPTGLGGVLYAPDQLHPDVLDLKQAMALTPTADDVWLFFMARRAGASFRKTGVRRRFHNWNGTQDSALYRANAFEGDRNDQQIGAMIAAYGWPDAPAS